MDAPSDIDALADALREDGVVIDRVMGSGDVRSARVVGAVNKSVMGSGEVRTGD